MDDQHTVNCIEPIPVTSFAGDVKTRPASERSSKTTAGKPVPERMLRENGEGKESERSMSFQDRILNTLLQHVIPTDPQKSTNGSNPGDQPPWKHVDRPGFSIPLMSNNFRRFNARIGVAFVFQTRVIRLFSWRFPTQTLSFLAIYTFVCLNPSLLAVLPLAACLFFIMVPAFLARHPAPPSTVPTDVYSYQGPPTAPPSNIKPVNELSKDFFRNMRDLQNSMEDFSRTHDQVIKWLAPPTNFSNEALSSTIFLFLFMSCCLIFIASHIIPWRAILLLAGWTATLLGHPNAQAVLLSTNSQDLVRPRSAAAQSFLDSWIASDIVLDAAPETREVEIFERQRRTTHGPEEWESWVFSASPYEPLSPARISGDRPKGTRFFEDVRAPKGWEWSEKKWTLDLGSRKWVEERMVTGVEVEMEGERWVYDLLGREGQEVESAGAPRAGKGKEAKKMVDWEEGTGLGWKGEWRRRRWVRLVRRKVLKDGRE